MRDIKARLKQLHPTPGHSWFWDEDQWALLLSNPHGKEAGYIAIAPTKDGRWAIRVVLGPPFPETTSQEVLVVEGNVVLFAGYDQLEQTFATLKEAKRKADRLLGWNSCEIPRSRDSESA